jgi:thiamine pyrophosphokinase
MTNKLNKILIITGGQVEDSFLSELVMKGQYSMIIAADNGLTVADRLNLPLDFIVGDFDSVSESVLQKYREKSTPMQTFPTEKDKTDTQIAMELALMYNPSELDIIGATGNRLDHVLANIHLLLLPLQLNVHACMIDTKNKIYLKNESFDVEKRAQYGNFISLLPFTEKVSGLTLKGFKYPLNNITLVAGSSLGISNEIRDELAQIELSAGTLIVIEAMD